MELAQGINKNKSQEICIFHGRSVGRECHTKRVPRLATTALTPNYPEAMVAALTMGSTMLQWTHISWHDHLDGESSSTSCNLKSSIQ